MLTDIGPTYSRESDRSINSSRINNLNTETPMQTLEHLAKETEAEDPHYINSEDIEAQSDSYDDDFEKAESTSGAFARQLSRVLTNSSPPHPEKEIKIPSMGLNKPLPRDFPDPEPYTVQFDGPDDPLHPHNWPVKRKIISCLAMASSTCSVAFGSSVFSPAVTTVAKDYHIGRTVATLGVSLYVLGFACGPIVWAPLSELFGRKPVLLISCFVFTCFQFACATGKDIQTILISRAFGGLFGAATFVVVPGAFADMFNNNQRGLAINMFVLSIFMMPILAPIVGQFITSSYLGWRFTAYITGIMSGTSLICLLFYKESHHPIILVNKAKEIKKLTGNWLIHAPHDEFELTLKDIVQKNISRPLRMLIKEPILLLISIYNAFIYAILYMLLTAYPVVFELGYGITGGVGQLPYLGVAIGMILGGFWNYLYEGKYRKAVLENNGKPVPEARLYPIFLASVLFPLGLLWFTWSGHYHKQVHWMVPTASGVFIGFGLFIIFTSTMNYIIDTYLIFAASAIAANTFLRSGLACAFPLFSLQMFENMGVNWAGLMLALFAIVLIPVPVLFFKYGKQLRTKSKYAFVLS